MPMIFDPNEAFAWFRACQNVDLLRQMSQAIGARLQELEAGTQAQMGEAGGQLRQPHVQPTDEYNAGPLAQPLVGPAPVGVGSDIYAQARAVQDTERAQMASGGRGVGHPPVGVAGTGMNPEADEGADPEKVKAATEPRQGGKAEEDAARKAREESRAGQQGGQQGGKGGQQGGKGGKG